MTSCSSIPQFFCLTAQSSGSSKLADEVKRLARTVDWAVGSRADENTRAEGSSLYVSVPKGASNSILSLAQYGHGQNKD